MAIKVYFDARMIDHPGIGRYIRCLLQSIKEDAAIELHLLGNKEKIRKFLPFANNIIDFNYPIYSISEQIGYMNIKKVVGNNILHIPHYNVPILTRYNLIATIHDIMHISNPKGASSCLAPLYMKFMVKEILRNASSVICVSNATKTEIERVFSEHHGKLNVIHEGVDRVFKKIDDMSLLKRIKDKYNLPDKFILYVGSIRRHKNIGALLDSFGRLRKRMPELNLVLVGRLSQDVDIKKDEVMYLGEIESDEELTAIYNLASCLLNLSLCEGFGLTILEAQKCGLPVVCSDIPVHKEIGGDGIMAVQASYIDQICDNLYNILSDNAVREPLVSRGFQNVARFDWHIAAQNTIDLYRKIGNEGSDSSRLASGDARRRAYT